MNMHKITENQKALFFKKCSSFSKTVTFSKKNTKMKSRFVFTFEGFTSFFIQIQFNNWAFLPETK